MGTKRRAPRLGDVYELALDDGRFGYLQYVNRHRDPPVYGAFVRVFDLIATEPVTDVATLPDGHRFCTFFPVGPAANNDDIRLVGTLRVPEDYSTWPRFKAYNESAGGERTWYLCELGKRDEKVDHLQPEHLDLPLRQIVTPPLLRKRLLEGWTPRAEAR